MTNLRQKIWLTIFSGSIISNHGFSIHDIQIQDLLKEFESIYTHTKVTFFFRESL